MPDAQFTAEGKALVNSWFSSLLGICCPEDNACSHPLPLECLLRVCVPRASEENRDVPVNTFRLHGHHPE